MNTKSNLNNQQLLSDGLPSNIVIRGRDFYRDFVEFFRCGETDVDVGIGVASYDGPDGRNIEFYGRLSPKLVRELKRIPWHKRAKGLGWRDSRTGEFYALPNLAWLADACAEGFGSEAFA